MLKSFLGLLLMGYHFVIPAFSSDYNARLLDLNADELSRKIWTGTSIPRESIQEKIDFIYDMGLLEGQAREFEEVHARTVSIISDHSFLSFSSSCKEIYDEGDSKTKVAVSMLFKAVTDKSSAQFKRLQKFTRVKAEKQKVNISAPKYFGKADKSIPLDSY